jgi:two-component system sensor histidine kinase/response regulator
MISSQASPEEASRIEALRQYAVLDTPPEAALDDITAMAAQICGTPFAVIALADQHRQWFKARFGLEATEIAREDSFCAHGIFEQKLFIVPDAMEDERFMENPRINCEGGMRFYAGAPLVTPEGVTLGALCVLDRVPRTISPVQKQALEVLARQVMTHLELHRQMMALRLSEEVFSNAFEHAPIGMALVSTDGRWLKVNQSLCQLLGYSAEEFHTKTFQDVTHPDDLETDLEHVHELLSGKTSTYQMEKRYFDKEGRIVWVELSVSLVCDKEKSPLYFISQIQDITASREAMARQQELTQKAQAGERAKSEFLAIMSHEIRTPLNGVIGMADILADTELNPMQRECVATINVSGESLLAVINDILDYSKIEAGRLEMENRSFDLRQCVEESIDVFAAQIRAKHLEAIYLVAPEIPTFVTGDATRLRQILVNLIGNAVKFTAQGKITVNVESKNQDEDGYHLQFSVADSGIGIPEEMIDKLFHAFQQVDTSTTRRYGGSGLGLAISKRLTEFMGGTIWVESKLGVGSNFHFSVVLKASPLEEAEASGQTSDKKLDGALGEKHPLRILLAEDNDVNQKVGLMMLSRLGYTVDVVENGKQVLEAVNTATYDVILMDIQMPEMNGIEAGRRVREKFGEKCPMIIALTAEALEGDEERFLGLGFNGYLSKPLQARTLQRCLRAIKPLSSTMDSAVSGL